MKKVFTVVTALAVVLFLFASQGDCGEDSRKDLSASPSLKSCVLDEEFKVILAQCDKWCKDYGFSGKRFVECKMSCIDSRCEDLEKRKK